jgi:hypothetical protein
MAGESKAPDIRVTHSVKLTRSGTIAAMPDNHVDDTIEKLRTTEGYAENESQ